MADVLFAAYRPFAGNLLALGVPAVWPIASTDHRATPKWYADIRQRAVDEQMADPRNFVPELQSFTLSPCFAAPLKIDR